MLSFSIYTCEETAELVDCRLGLHHQLHSKAFWEGFEDMNGEFSQVWKRTLFDVHTMDLLCVLVL